MEFPDYADLVMTLGDTTYIVVYLAVTLVIAIVVRIRNRPFRFVYIVLALACALAVASAAFYVVGGSVYETVVGETEVERVSGIAA
jgi:predicted Abi (CAAX) family protease